VPTVTLQPSADGALLECQPVPTPPFTHFDKVDEAVPNDWTDYVYNPDNFSSIRRDSYVKPASGIPVGSTINSVRIYNRGLVDWGEFMELGFVRTLLRNSVGALQYGVLQQPTVWTTISDLYVNSPFTGVPWTLAEVEGLQIGTYLYNYLEFGSSIASVAYCSTVWVVIDYTPPEAPPAKAGLDPSIVLPLLIGT